MSNSSSAENNELSFDELLARLREAEETLDAIRLGQVDAVVVGGPSGQQVYTLENADRPYRAIIEQMQEGAITLQEDGLLLYCNGRFASLLGMPREALIGQPVTHYFADESVSFLKLLSSVGKKGVSSEFTLRAHGGELVPVTVSLVKLDSDEDTPSMVSGVVTDLTHSRQRSHELSAANSKLASQIRERRRAEAGLQLALNAAEMGYWELDLSTGQATTSLRHDNIFGFTEKLSDWNFNRFLEHTIEEDRATVEKAFTTKRSNTVEFSCRIRRSGDNAIRWLHVKGLAYVDDNVANGVAGVVIDVTNARETEEQLRQAQKMEAVGQLTGGIAHDFNNLLAGISGSIEMISTLTERGKFHDVDRFIISAQSSARRAATLTQRLLAFSRRQTLDPKPTEVNRLVAGMEDLIRRTVGPGIELEVVGAGGLWMTKVDSSQLESALLNLCINARDAMAPLGGHLTVETANKWLDDRAAKERDLPPGQYISLCVTDTGSGRDEEVIARAFDPFFTTKPVGQGTGLGLSMVYGFARQSGGQVRIYSELGEGTTICIYLPRYVGTVEPQLPAEETLIASDGRGETVLVVDDEPTIRMLVCEVLLNNGYRPLEAGDGPTALAILNSNISIDLLVTDVGLPGGLNGRQVADAARVARPDLKVLFITGYAENAAIRNGVLEPGMEIMTKPFGMAAIADRIRLLLAN